MPKPKRDKNQDEKDELLARLKKLAEDNSVELGNDDLARRRKRDERDKKALFARLKKLAGDDSAGPWDEDHLGTLFHWFRPDGFGLESALSFLPDASKYVERLLRVYRAAKHPTCNRDAYFVVRSPEEATKAKIVAMGKEYLANLRVLAGVIGNAKLKSYLASVTRVQVVPAEKLNPESNEGLTVYEAIGDFFGYTNSDDPIRLLREAYYSIACDRYLALYLQWPYYEHLCSVDCFEPYFRLWQHGYSCGFDVATLNLALS
jgi:hypothetical protein